MKKKSVATNDKFIEIFIRDSNFQVRKNGTIWTCLDRGSHKTNVWRELELKPKSNGYVTIQYKGKKLTVHRIVFRVFGKTLDKFLQINHKNGNRSDNSFLNLELVSQSINLIHCFTVLGRHGPISNRKLNPEQLIQLRKMVSEEVSYSSIQKELEISKSTVVRIIKGKTYNDRYK